MMTTVICNPERELNGYIPSNLKAWMDERTLIVFILEAASQLNIAPLLQLVPRTSTPSTQVLLVLLTYCYATSNYSTHEICRLSREYNGDEGIKYILGKTAVDYKVIKTFRRQWQLVIQQCLYNLFKLAWQCRPWAPDVIETPSEEGGSHYVEPLGLMLSVQLLMEADRRLALAVQTDCADSDI